MIGSGVTVETRGPWFAQATPQARGVFETGHPAVEAMFHQWVARYQAAMRERYVAASRGDGTWPPLAASTLHARAMRLSRTTRNRAGGRMVVRGGPNGIKVWTQGGRWTKTAYKQYFQGALNAAILRDTGVLFNALDIGAAGNEVRREGPSVVYGIGGPANHPGGHYTIGQIAAAHQAGGGRLPKREILVTPSDDVVNAMLGDARRAITAIFGGR